MYSYIRVFQSASLIKVSRLARPKVYARRSKVRSRRSKMYWRLSGYLLFYGVLAAGLGYAVWHGYKTLRSHPAFAINTLIITGASDKAEGDMRESLAWVMGRNIFGLDLTEIQGLAQSHPWIERATINGILPNTIKIVLTERVPQGLARRDDEILVIGEDALPICTYGDYGKALDLPVLTGLDRSDDWQEKALRGLEVLAEIKQASLLFWDNIETLNMEDEKNLQVHLRNIQAPIYLGDQVVTENLRNYLSIAQRIQDQHPTLAYIELGFPNQVAIMPGDVSR